jgi:hypothetical protein
MSHPTTEVPEARRLHRSDPALDPSMAGPDTAAPLAIARLLSLLLTALVAAILLFQEFDASGRLPLPGPVPWHTHLGFAGALGGIVAVVAPIALSTTIAAAVLLCHRPVPQVLTLMAALCLAGTIAVWGSDIVSLNLVLSDWVSASELPGNWTELRASWEWFQAMRTGLSLMALGALVLSLILDTASEAMP